MNQTKGMRGPIRRIHAAVGQNPDGRRGTSETCFRSCSASTVFQLLMGFGQQRLNFAREDRELRIRRIRQRSEDEHLSCAELSQTRPDDLAQPPLRAIAHHGVAYGLGYDETHASGVGIIGVSQAVRHEVL